MLNRLHIRLLAAPLALCLLDVGLTLHGQRPGYWSGDRTQANEMSPEGGQLLRVHPVAFLGGIVAWMGVFSGLILLLPR
jgi:hypothetical protein